MPDKFRKSGGPVSRSGSLNKPAARPVRSNIPPRPTPAINRPAAPPQRVDQRLVKRQAARQQAATVQPRPRPVVRPSAPPMKQMPKVQAPPAASLNRRVHTRPVRPGTQPAAATPARPSPRLAAALAAAAGTAVAGGLVALRSSAAHPDLASGVVSLENILNDLQSRSDFSHVATDMADLDQTIQHVLNLLESARDKGYVYQGDMEEIAYQAIDRWQTVQAEVESSMTQQASSMQTTLGSLNPYLQRLNTSLSDAARGASALSAAQNQANQVLWDLEKAERALQANYGQIETDIRNLNTRLTRIHWALDQLTEARFDLAQQEDLVMAVPARWDKEGKDDPEGILFLSSKRLIFERKEKLATKKVLFVTTSSELVQEVIIDQTLSEIKGLKAVNKGLFGHQDFMEVTFADGKLGAVAFHLNGQDSQHWVTLIERAKSGKIEEERASGSGLSFSDLTGELTNADLLAIQNEVNELQDEMMLKQVRTELTELENDVHSLSRSLADLRARGYAVEKSLEADLQVLTDQWERIKSRTEATLEHQAQLLSGQMANIQTQLAALMGLSGNLSAARPKYIALKSAVASAEAQAVAAEDTVLDQFDEYADEIEGLAAHLDWVDWMLDALSTASFRLLATESGVAATEAIWLRPGLEPENGILYLTDQRLLWEDRVGDFELKLAVPVQQVADLFEESDDEAEFEVLAVRFDSGDAPVPVGQFQLALPVADDWIKMVKRARTGDYAQDRAVALDPAELERIRNAPQQCSNCGAAYTAPVLRGQTEITCEYCGVVTRI
ncbi:MAG: hypothetical protein JW862_19945 [Anaerolineales bacterium]|nr:hypothetical protein [Anaerolineales bacterium]